MRLGLVIFAVVALQVDFAAAQISMNGGNYSQNFDSLADSGGNNVWLDNLTLPGWYASKSVSPSNITNYIAGPGSGTTGSCYSFGAAASANRALGLLVSSTPGNMAFGLRFTNDTSLAQSNFLVSFTGEQWRNANSNAQMLAFSFQTGNALTNADAAGTGVWANVTPLNFTTPITGGTATALDGTAAANQTGFANVPLTGVLVLPGQELFLRWYLARPSSGSSHGVAIDNLTVSFQAAGSAPLVSQQPQSVAANEGGFALFSAGATGGPAPNFLWQFNGTNLPGATGATLSLTGLTSNQVGNYSVIVTNFFGATNSRAASLIVMPTSLAATNGAITLLTYNVAGNNSGANTNGVLWSTNAAQVQAIGRELMCWRPDIITFNEIPVTNGVAQMADWLKAFLPGYFLVTNSLGDGYVQNVIVSRFPILTSASHLAFSSLTNFGYTGTGFTRDLFEAKIAVPNWPLPLHMFVAHLKSTGSTNPQDDANKRAAMASAVSNYFATVFLPGTNGAHPYVLSGDLNEDAFFPDSNFVSGQPIQRLTSSATGLQMTIPVNPITHTDLTESIQGTLNTRFDYILPCGLLFSNIDGAQVFRTDLLTNFPPNLFSNDDIIASDHLPVLMVFKNPFDTPFKLTSVAHTNQNVMLQWESQNNRSFSIEASSNLADWMPFTTNLITSTTNSPFVFITTNASDRLKFFRIYRVP
jgi:endonuclease/exonuclease/phosphatase family metal-dependent hydrolase